MPNIIINVHSFSTALYLPNGKEYNHNKKVSLQFVLMLYVISLDSHWGLTTLNFLTNALNLKYGLVLSGMYK